MSGRDLESFMENADEFAALSDDDKARLFAGEALQGDTDKANTPDADTATDAATESSATPTAATAVEPGTDEPATKPQEPVVLAKDGEHTIPFSVLEAERQRVRDLEQQLQALQPAKDAPAETEQQATTPTVEADEELKQLFAERDDALYSGDTKKTAELNMKIFTVQQERATQAAIERIDARNAEQSAKDAEKDMQRQVEANAAAVAEKYPFLDFKSENANRDAIDLVVAQRDRLMAQGVPFADAIVQAADKVALLFAPKQTTTTPEPKPDAAARAAEVISKAKTQVPTSLSSVPAGASVHHDEGEAIRNRSGLSLLNTFEGKSADDILKLMSRVI